MGEEIKSLSVFVGTDNDGKNVNLDIKDTPFILVAGTVSTGKTNLVKSWILELASKHPYEEIKFIIFNSTRVEYLAFKGIPHLLTDPIYETYKFHTALQWLEKEVNERFKKLEQYNATSVQEFNNSQSQEYLPSICLVVDVVEALDEESKALIATLLLKTKVVGISFIIVCQRPSVDAVPSLMKVSMPTRISFKLPSHFDSQTVIDKSGAEKLNHHPLKAGGFVYD